jgi:hypothetical protein
MPAAVAMFGAAEAPGGRSAASAMRVDREAMGGEENATAAPCRAAAGAESGRPALPRGVREIDAQLAAHRMRCSVRWVTARCPQLEREGLARRVAVPGGGKPRWLIRTDAHPALRDIPLAGDIPVDERGLRPEQSRKLGERLAILAEWEEACKAAMRADVPAGEFWKRGGGNAIIKRVADRYNLGSTTVPYDGEWWNTMSTTSNVVRYYELLLNGAGGLPAQQAEVILGDLAASTPIAADGYPQRFGIPDGLYAEPVAVKQGWMCCWAPDKQVHLSTGVVGSDRRYVIAVAAMQSADEKTARNTLTRIVKTMFPGGQI